MSTKSFLRRVTIALLILALPSGLALAAPTSMPSEPRDWVNWDGESPMVPGILYRMPYCDPGQPEAPCYVEVEQNIRQSGRIGQAKPWYSGSTYTIQCGVNVTNWLGGWVASLWEDVNIHWVLPTTSTANWASVSTSSAFAYGWIGVWGVNPGTPTGINYYFGGTHFTAGGTVTYLGFDWGAHSVNLHVYGDEAWSCSAS